MVRKSYLQDREQNVNNRVFLTHRSILNAPMITLGYQNMTGGWWWGVGWGTAYVLLIKRNVEKCKLKPKMYRNIKIN